MYNMKIFLATDHAGFEMKEYVKNYLIENGNEVEDCGALSFDPDDDYPKYISIAAKNVSENASTQISTQANTRSTEANENPNKCVAIIFGGSGQGEAIVANRHPNVRAIVYTTSNLDLIKLGREHNNANVLSIGARFISNEEAINAVSLFLKTEFATDSRHARRISQIEDLI